MKVKRCLVLVIVLLGAVLMFRSNSLAEGGIPDLYSYSIYIPLVFGDGEEGEILSDEAFEPIPDIQGITQYRQDDDRWKCEQLGTCNAALNPPPEGQDSICSSDGMCAEGEEDVITTIGSDGRHLKSTKFSYTIRLRSVEICLN